MFIIPFIDMDEPFIRMPSLDSHHRSLLLLAFHWRTLRLEHGIATRSGWLLLLHTPEPVHGVNRSSRSELLLWLLLLLLLLLGRRARSRACVMLAVATHIAREMGSHVIHRVHHLPMQSIYLRIHKKKKERIRKQSIKMARLC